METCSYLFAIEDPFEINHNVSRTCSFHGVKKIRDEFRRANRILTMREGEAALRCKLFEEAPEEIRPQHHRKQRTAKGGHANGAVEKGNQLVGGEEGQSGHDGIHPDGLAAVVDGVQGLTVA